MKQIKKKEKRKEKVPILLEGKRDGPGPLACPFRHIL
jgi:hypothetical protein